MEIAAAIKAGCSEWMPAWKPADKAIPDIVLGTIERRTEQPVAMRFAEMVNAHGERPAVIAPGRTWSYRELSGVAEVVRRQLEEANVVRGTGVGILLKEPAQQIAAMLGVLAAGGFYVVLDAEFPIERLKAIGNDGAFTLLLTEPGLANYSRDAVAEAVPRLWWQNVEPTPGNEDRPVAIVESKDLAYVTYTSGSTGRPKGVMHTQANLQHEAAVHAWALDLGPSDRASLLYSPSVIGSVRDIFGMLLSGGAVCPFPFKRKGWGALVQWLQEQRITQLHAVPAIFRELMRAMPPGGQLANVRTVFLSGDRVTPQDVKLFQRHFPTDAKFYTGLGASEANSIYTHWTVDPATTAEGERLPSGWPLPHKEIIIRDDEGRPVAPGAAGTITVVSRYLACGYWNQPELTADVFVPAIDGSGQQYDTGDRGYFDQDGRLVHLGRGDQQIKINGERIELGEIEQALLQERTVSQAVVRAFAAAADEPPRLAAFIVAALDAFDEREVRRNLAQRLPPAARTLRIVRLAALPMTSNGKIDRQALADPGAAKEDTHDDAMNDWSETEQSLLDAAISNKAMSWFYETLRISNWRDRIRSGEIRLNMAEIARMARRLSRRITRTKARRADASGPAIDAVRHDPPADYAGWVLLGYSSTMAWPRWIWPRLGWEKFHRASVRERRLSGPHRELWSKNNIEIIAGQVAELASTQFTQSVTPHD